MIRINWQKSCSYDYEQKELFHRAAKQRLRRLAKELGFDKADYELRSNKAGIAISGEVTLHHNHIYIQVAQSCMGPSADILIRSCEGKRDYTGGANNFLPLWTLDRTEPLITLVQQLIGGHH